MILDGGPCKLGLESTILSFAGARPLLLRHGAISREAIESRIGPVEEAVTGGPVEAPGQLARHYSPAVPISIVEDPAEIAGERRGRAALLAMTAVAEQAGFARVEVLSASGDLEEAASKLFSTMRDLDDSDVDQIFVLAVPETGIGRAIMDRLRRAAHR
jgi:L-threonylcarbamoyladenylate synthase